MWNMELNKFCQKTNIILLVSFLISVFLSRLVSSYDCSEAYNHDPYLKTDRSNWMANLSDSTSLNRISFPGTHDSLSFYGGFAAQTQSLQLKDQLKAGIRALDIRCRYYQDSFPIHHGPIFQKIYFDSVLQTVVDFIKSNPGETILLKIKEEYDSDHNTKSFWDVYKQYVSGNTKYIWNPNKSVPSLGEVRGKIVILDDYSLSNSSTGFTEYGISYKNKVLFDSQNFYQLKTPLELPKKWKLIKEQILKANSSDFRSSNYFVNHLSGNGDATAVFPYFVASGHVTTSQCSNRMFSGITDPFGKKMFPPEFPRLHCLGGICMYYYEGMNELTYQFLKSSVVQFVGIVFSDFPGSGLVDAVINLNFKM